MKPSDIDTFFYGAIKWYWQEDKIFCYLYSFIILEEPWCVWFCLVTECNNYLKEIKQMFCDVNYPNAVVTLVA